LAKLLFYKGTETDDQVLILTKENEIDRARGLRVAETIGPCTLEKVQHVPLDPDHEVWSVFEEYTPYVRVDFNPEGPVGPALALLLQQFEQEEDPELVPDAERLDVVYPDATAQPEHVPAERVPYGGVGGPLT